MDAPPAMCPNCGSQINPGAAVCSNCGARLGLPPSSGVSGMRIAFATLALIAAWPLGLFGGCQMLFTVLDRRTADWLPNFLLYAAVPTVASVLLVIVAVKLLKRS